MIDIVRESCFRLAEAPKHLPPGRSGKRIHVSTVFRWAQRGIRGVTLETVRVGGAMFTSTEAIQRFCRRVTDAARTSGGCLDKDAAPDLRADRAAEELTKIGV
jgi:hypothetical protein